MPSGFFSPDYDLQISEFEDVEKEKWVQKTFPDFHYEESITIRDHNPDSDLELKRNVFSNPEYDCDDQQDQRFISGETNNIEAWLVCPIKSDDINTI